MKLPAIICLIITCATGTIARAEESAFRNACLASAKTAQDAGLTAVPGKDGWLFLASEMRFLGVGSFWGDAASTVSRASKPEWADPRPAIADFKRQLDEAGIQLILLPVPPKTWIYADKTELPPQLENELPPHQEFYRLLKDEDQISILDLTGDFMSARAEDAQKGPLYCQTDSHWSPRACELAAAKVKLQIGSLNWPASRPTESFASEQETLVFTGDLSHETQTASSASAKETLPIRYVGRNIAGKRESIKPDLISPILLMGDSHCLIFHAGGDMLAQGAGLVDQLALEFGMPIDLLGVRGSGASTARIDLMRRIRADTEYLAGKKAVIWCFAARDFTESDGWRPVPLR